VGISHHHIRGYAVMKHGSERKQAVLCPRRARESRSASASRSRLQVGCGALSTRATAIDDSYIIIGQKVFTSGWTERLLPAGDAPRAARACSRASRPSRRNAGFPASK